MFKIERKLSINIHDNYKEKSFDWKKEFEIIK